MRCLVYTKEKPYLSAPRALVVSEEVLEGTKIRGLGGAGVNGGGGGVILMNWLLVHATLPLPSSWLTIFSFPGAVRGMTTASIYELPPLASSRPGRKFIASSRWCVRLRKSIYVRSTLSHNFASVAPETVPVFVWQTMALSRPFKEDRRALPLSTPLSSRRSVM